MRRKKRIFTILVMSIFSLLLTISIGFSMWLITDKIIIKPTLDVENVIIKYFDNNEATYDGNILLPSSSELELDVNSEELNYYYKIKDSDNDYIEVDLNNKKGPINAGTYSIKIEFLASADTNPDDNIDDSIIIEKEVTFIINKAPIDISMISFESSTLTYDRFKHYIIADSTTIPSLITNIVYDCDNSNYNCSDSVNMGASEAGTYNVTATLEYDEVNYYVCDNNNDEMSNILSATLTINPKPISELIIGFSNNENSIFYYTEADIPEISNTFIIKYGDTYSLIKDTEYSIDFTETKELGTYTETITAVGNNYTGTAQVVYHIKKSALKISISQTAENYKDGRFNFEYTGTQVNFDQYVTVTNSQGNTITANIAYTYKKLGVTNYTNTGLPTKVDVYWVMVTASHDKYDSTSTEIQFVIEAIDITGGTITLAEYDLTYDGTQKTVTIQSAKIKNNTVELDFNDTTMFDVKYSNNIDAGTNTAVVTISSVQGGNYKGNLSATFTIKKATPTNFILPIFAKDKYIEGEEIAITTAGYAQYLSTRLTGNITSNMKSVAYPTNSANTNETVTVTFVFNPTDINNNGISNYTTITGTKTFTMYAVAKIGSVYYGTIEKGLAEATSNQTVWVLTDIYTTTGYYPTIRDSEKAIIKDKVTLTLTYASSDYTTGYKIFADGEASATDTSEGNPAYAKIASGTTLTIQSGGTLNIGAFVSGSSAAVGKHAVLMNNGIINLESGAITNAYGYIKGMDLNSEDKVDEGIFNANSGSTINDILRVYDFAGARYAGGMYFKKLYVSLGGVGSSTSYNNIMPFNSYSFHNISCKLNLYTGATYTARTQFNISNTIYSNQIIMFGSGGMFQLTTPGGYVERTIANTTSNSNINGDFVSTNQDSTQKEIYNFFSSVQDNSITVKLKIIVLDVNVTTGKNLAMPIGMMDINIKDGYELYIKTNSYKFLPGSRVTIEDGASLKTDSGVNIIFYEQYYDDYACYDSSGNLITPESGSSFSYYSKHKSLYDSNKNVKNEYVSKLIVNGTFTCNGNFGGIIEATSDTGIVKLTNSYAQINRLTSISYLDVGASDILGALTGMDMQGSVKIDKVNPKMHLYNGTTINEDYSSVASGNYLGIGVTNDQVTTYGWRAEKVVINYDLNGGSGTTPSSTSEKDASNGYAITSADLPTFATDSTPIKYGYTYANKWAFDPEGTNIVEAGDKVYASTILYAVWTANDYKITYKNVYYPGTDSSLGNSYTTNPNCDEGQTYTTYTIEDVIVLARPTIVVNGKSLVFGGWFTNEDCTDDCRITMIEKSYEDITLYGYWYPADTTTIDIVYNVTIDDTITLIPTGITPVDDVAAIVGTSVKWEPSNLADMINKKTDIDGYFQAWYYDAACTIPYDADVDKINSYLLFDDDEDKTGTLILYTKILKKFSVYTEEVHHTNTSTELSKKTFIGWYSPNQETGNITFTNRTTADEPYYLMYINQNDTTIITNGSSQVLTSNFTITGDTIISARYLKIIEVEIEGPGTRKVFGITVKTYDLYLNVKSGIHGTSLSSLIYSSKNYLARGDNNTYIYIVEGAIIEKGSGIDIPGTFTVTNCTDNGDGTYTVGSKDVKVSGK